MSLSYRRPLEPTPPPAPRPAGAAAPPRPDDLDDVVRRGERLDRIPPVVLQGSVEDLEPSRDALAAPEAPRPRQDAGRTRRPPLDVIRRVRKDAVHQGPRPVPHRVDFRQEAQALRVCHRHTPRSAPGWGARS